MTDEKKASEKTTHQISDKERINKGQILVRIVIEVLGAPKSHVEESVQLVIDKVNRISDIEVISENTYEAEEKDNGLFSTFSEMEIWFNSVDLYLTFIFDFTPSSVELIQPETLPMTNNMFSGMCNDFLLKIHGQGMKLSDIGANLELAKKNADALIRNFINFALEKPRTADELAKILGIPKENVKAIMDNFVKAGVASENNDVYIRITK